MKITITPDGEIHMETNGAAPGEIAGVILAVQNELRKQREAQAHEDIEKAIPVSLNGTQSATWEWMADHDTEAGIHVGAIAKAFKITVGAAGQRCYQLVKDGYAERISMGNYRAVTP